MKTSIAALFALTLVGCDVRSPVSASGVGIASTQVKPGSDGLTVEQRNIKDRLQVDNKPGSIKHLYVISAMSGQVIIYSTVRGKVTSGGKRLTPVTASAYDFTETVDIGGREHTTNEVLQDDGAYGTSDPYIYWFDTRNIYHQHFLGGGQIVHVSDQPLAVHGILINMELNRAESR